MTSKLWCTKKPNTTSDTAASFMAGLGLGWDPTLLSCSHHPFCWCRDNVFRHSTEEWRWLSKVVTNFWFPTWEHSYWICSDASEWGPGVPDISCYKSLFLSLWNGRGFALRSKCSEWLSAPALAFGKFCSCVLNFLSYVLSYVLTRHINHSVASLITSFLLLYFTY